LATSWDIDIAMELEDYLLEIEKINYTFDSGGSKVNFVEGNNYF